MLRAGSAVVEITPPLPSFMAGMGGNRPLATAVHDPICARALVIEDDAGGRLALCSLDTLGVNTVDRRAIQKIVCGKLGWLEHQILIAGTHTHNGPPVLRFYPRGDYPQTAPLAKAVSREEFERDWDGNASDGFWQFAIPRIASAYEQAAARLRPAEFAIGAGSVTLNINRWHARGAQRIFIPYEREARGIQGDSSQDLPANQPCDQQMLVLHFRERGAGATIATWQHWSAHPICVCLCADELSADYPCYAARALEKELGGTYLFTNGTLGDTHPRDYDTGFANAAKLGDALAREALEALSGRQYSDRAPVAIAETSVFLRFSEETRRRGLNEAWHWDARAANAAGGRTTSVSAGRVGDFGFVTWPGEPYSDLGFKLKPASPFPFTALVSCANDYQGYFALRETFDGKTFDTPATQPGAYEWPAADELLRSGCEALTEMWKTGRGR